MLGLDYIHFRVSHGVPNNENTHPGGRRCLVNAEAPPLGTHQGENLRWCRVGPKVLQDGVELARV